MAIPIYKWFFLLYYCLHGSMGAVTSPSEAGFHPLYVSITELNHNMAEKSLEISCKIFTDDFEKAIFKTFQQKTDLSNPHNKAEADKLVSDYIKKHLLIKVDGKAVSMEFIGFERERDAVWSYFEVKQVNTAPKKIDIRNDLLYESYDSQINLMHVTVSGNRKSSKLNYPDTNAEFAF